jgi:hypothetical protein
MLLQPCVPGCEQVTGAASSGVDDAHADRNRDNSSSPGHSSDRGSNITAATDVSALFSTASGEVVKRRSPRKVRACVFVIIAVGCTSTKVTVS